MEKYCMLPVQTLFYCRENELLEKKIQYQNQLVRELKEERIHQLQAEEVEKLKEKELLKFNTLQRLKNTEVNEEFTKMMAKKRRLQQQNNKQIWEYQRVSELYINDHT